MTKPPATPAPKPRADEWRPHSTPGFQVNGLGQLRTVNHVPGNVPTLPLPNRKPAT